MLITILNQSRRNGLADMYKNMLNLMADKNKFNITTIMNFFIKKL